MKKDRVPADLQNLAEAARSGSGVIALFAGAPGTGKTMAGMDLASALEMPFLRVDLQAVVSKYIGETEKNLDRIFDAAETAGAVLFLNEAEALFGKRVDPKDASDRYANAETEYLMERMERFRGVAILTTKHKEVIDRSLLKRIRHVLEFPPRRQE